MVASQGGETHYRESQIQDGFISWLTRTRGYVQLYEDAYTQQNTPVDSVGFIGAVPVLVEVKAYVHAGMVEHAHGTEGNLEYKLFRAVRDLYTGAKTVIGAKLASWDSKTPPEIIFVAGGFSPEALVMLKELLARRGDHWRFGAHIYCWDGDQATCLFRLPAPAYVDPANVVFPQLNPPPSAKRSAPLTLSTVRTLLADKGLDACLDAMLAEMAQRKLKVQARYVRSITYGKAVLDGSKQLTLVGIWPYESTADDGLLVSLDLPKFPQCFTAAPIDTEDVPGAPGPRVGYLNLHRYLRSPQAVALFWATLAPTSQSTHLDCSNQNNSST